MADIQRVVTRLETPPGIVTFAGKVTAVQVSGCIEDFIGTVVGLHDFVVCEGNSARLQLCGVANPGFVVIPSITWVCPTIIDFTWTHDGLGGLSTHNMTFRSVGPYTLSVSNNGDIGASITSSPAGISCGGDCSEPFAKDTIVTLTATPSAGHAFVNWTVDDPLIGTGPFIDNPLTITIDRNWGLTANYVDLVTVIGDGTASVISQNQNQQVVVAIPGPNSYLVGVECV